MAMQRIRRMGIMRCSIVCAMGGVAAGLALPSGDRGADPPPATLRTKIVSRDAVVAHAADWGEMRVYFQGETLGTRSVYTAVATVRPGKAVYRAHRHAEEEYLVINEGSGLWQFGDKESPAKAGDILYVEPWVYHGLTNTGEKPLVFTVVKFTAKGVKVPERPDSRKDEL